MGVVVLRAILASVALGVSVGAAEAGGDAAAGKTGVQEVQGLPHHRGGQE